jgi:hypothetical protein
MRRANDFYPTPSWATEQLLARVWIGGVVLEPCHGAGDITRVLQTHSHLDALHTNDLDQKFEAHHHFDATDRSFWRCFPRGIDWTVTNPPFSEAQAILPLAYEHSSLGVAMLLRITYLEPCKGRAGWLKEYPPSRLLVLPRISFTGDGDTDLATCAWFVWEKGYATQVIEVIPDPSDLPGALLDGAA